MNLVKQLPIGLGLACLMFMSSCSKEEAVTPGTAVTNESSNLREEAPSFLEGHLAPTNGLTCVGCAANEWYLLNPGRDATSSLTAYAGNPSKKWVQPLPVPLTGSGSIITLVNSDFAGHVVYNLKKGKKYKITFSVSTTSLNDANGPSPYASKAHIGMSEISNANKIATKIIDFDGKNNQWITETIEFVATDTRSYIRIAGSSLQEESKLTYTNFHIGPNAVQRIN